ncbi:very short patch repair endonuclease [Protaetiibacter larvae]|uniref:Very short patch repair endonuclease n=1 Tax=Protaetiibacter larvae TaxID=2592654 RepID=A0A5C1YD86_9MICO|nr:very short patch repair endonuclease [Protaetiibacter larvae]QEO10722.1 very short patch repair endonuclease [Protaetiibacter larvae]
MQGNRSRDTKPELAVRRAAHALGLRYRVNARPLSSLRRSADLVFRRERVAVFIDGCFWHGCPEHHVASKSRVEYWGPKIEANRRRDADTDKLLRAQGWYPLRAWSHEDPAEVAFRVRALIDMRRAATG